MMLFAAAAAAVAAAAVRHHRHGHSKAPPGLAGLLAGWLGELVRSLRTRLHRRPRKRLPRLLARLRPEQGR
jgi:hypothetical protein